MVEYNDGSLLRYVTCMHLVDRTTLALGSPPHPTPPPTPTPLHRQLHRPTTSQIITDFADITKILGEGNKNRSVSATNMNAGELCLVRSRCGVLVGCKLQGRRGPTALYRPAN